MKIYNISDVHGKGILIAVSGNLCVLLLVLPLPLNLAISSDRKSALSVVEALAGSGHNVATWNSFFFRLIRNNKEEQLSPMLHLLSNCVHGRRDISGVLGCGWGVPLPISDLASLKPTPSAPYTLISPSLPSIHRFYFPSAHLSILTLVTFTFPLPLPP